MLGNNQEKTWKYVGNTTNPGNKLWDEYEHPLTGETTLHIHTPRKVTEFESCEHDGTWEMVDGYGNIQCRNCGLGKKIVWGIQIVKKGKLIDLMAQYSSGE